MASPPYRPQPILPDSNVLVLEPVEQVENQIVIFARASQHAPCWSIWIGNASLICCPIVQQKVWQLGFEIAPQFGPSAAASEVRLACPQAKDQSRC